VSSGHAPEVPSVSGDDLLYRLAAYSKYVALVRAQEEALEDGDLERHAQLGEARQEIQNQLGDAPSGEELVVASSDPEASALVEQALSSLRSAMARDEGMRMTLEALKRETAGSIRSMESRRGQVHSYLNGQDPRGAHPAPRVNRKG